MSDDIKVQYVLLLVLILFCSACAKTDFSSMDSAAVGVGTGTDGNGNGDGNNNGSGTDTNGGGSDNGGNGGGSEVPATGSKPTVEIRIPTDCVARSICRVYSVLTVSTGQAVSFDWATNDSAYQKNPGVIAQPNVHYVPTGGLIQLTNTQARQDMPIQALSNFTRILIPFRWENCKLEGQPTNCSSIEFKTVTL